eukprot:1050166-Pelagomonas_calceolata.AAC.1
MLSGVKGDALYQLASLPPEVLSDLCAIPPELLARLAAEPDAATKVRLNGKERRKRHATKSNALQILARLAVDPDAEGH